MLTFCGGHENENHKSQGQRLFPSLFILIRLDKTWSIKPIHVKYVFHACGVSQRTNRP